jgi:hypothetical protein
LISSLQAAGNLPKEIEKDKRSELGSADNQLLELG